MRHELNCGLPALRVNEGIELARGRWVAFQFDDDEWLPGGLQALVAGASRAGGDAVLFGVAPGTGFDTKLLLGLRARLDAIEIPKSPFTRATGLPRLRAHWVRPEIAVRVAFIEWTVHRKLRHSRLLQVLEP